MPDSTRNLRLWGGTLRLFSESEMMTWATNGKRLVPVIQRTYPIVLDVMFLQTTSTWTKHSQLLLTQCRGNFPDTRAWTHPLPQTSCEDTTTPRTFLGSKISLCFHCNGLAKLSKCQSNRSIKKSMVIRESFGSSFYSCWHLLYTNSSHDAKDKSRGNNILGF